jgi:tRNA-dependent cyclodipeptide synthase
MIKVKVPDMYRSIQKKSRNYVGLMGLSIGKQDFENTLAMDSYCDFMQENFLYGLFVIGDFPKKYNIMALDGDSEKRAEERTRIAGDNMRNVLERITRNYPLVKVTRWRNFMTPSYEHNLGVLRKAYTRDAGFQESVNDLVRGFLHSPANLIKLRADDRTQVALAKEYLLDELALLVAAPFSIPSPVCEIYPGRNEVHEQIQARQFSFCKDLHIKDNRVFMEAHYEPSN